MKYRLVNLARRPFVNARPVLRTTIFLWVFGGLLMILNAVHYGRSLVGLEDRKGRLESIEAEIEGESDRLSAAQDELRSLDLGAQNEEARYIQARLEERRFPWSRLFGQLAGVLPRDVRLFRVSPKGFETDPRRRSSSRSRKETDQGPRQTWLQIAGAAKSDQALVDLLDALFASPAFADPLLPGEATQEDGTINFQLSTVYFPDAEVSPLTSRSEASESIQVGSGGSLVGSGQLPPGSSEALDGVAGEVRGTSNGLSSPGRSPGAQRVSGGESRTSSGGVPVDVGPATADRDADPGSPSSTGHPRGDRATPRPLNPTASSPGVLR